MTTGQPGDYGSFEFSGWILASPFIFLSALFGCLIGLIPVFTASRGGMYSSAWFIFLAFFLLFLVSVSLSFVYTTRFRFTISPEGLVLWKARGVGMSMPWREVRDISSFKTTRYIPPSLNASYLRIFGPRKSMVIEDYMPPSKKEFYFAVALIFVYAGYNRIPFNDYGNLLMNREVYEMGFEFPMLQNQGQYFRMPKQTPRRDTGPTRYCPKCNDFVVPMNIGRCPKCGLRFA